MTNAVVYDVSGEFEGNLSLEKMIARAEAGDPKAQGLLATGYMGLGPSLWRCGGKMIPWNCKY